VAEQSSVTEQQDGTHPAAQVADLTTSQHEHSSMQAAQAATRKSMIDRVVGETELAELRASDDAVLSHRQPPGRSGVLVTLPGYSAEK
jgi:hypothetical protein